ncbi:MAG: hypothetical protein WAM60_22660, partial [Candidatus Promineifilaceae bacterium]
GADYTWAINYWMSAPFHALPMLDPELTEVGFGDYLNSSGSSVGTQGIVYGATLDVQRGLVQNANVAVQFPLFFPPDGGETWVLSHSLFEYPNLVTSCPGYSRPTGPPVIIQTGFGSGRPNVNSFVFSENGNAVPSCMFHEGSYSNPNPTTQEIGRKILDDRDAIIIVPQNPLKIGNSYEVTVTISGVPYTAQFTAVEPPY